MNRNATWILLLCLWGLSLAQCGGKESLSGKVKITLVPDDPVMVNAPLVLYPGSTRQRTLTPPWYIFSAKIDNQSNETVVLVTFGFKTQGTKNGLTTEGEVFLDPNVGCGTSTDNRIAVAIVGPHQVYTNNGGASFGCDETDINTTGYERWYVDGFPASDAESYFIEVSAQGWFEDSTGIPIERLAYEGFQMTQ